MDLERIRQRAYELWQQEGQPEGKQQEHWDRAVREITGNPDQSGAQLDSGADGDESDCEKQGQIRHAGAHRVEQKAVSPR